MGGSLLFFMLSFMAFSVFGKKKQENEKQIGIL